MSRVFFARELEGVATFWRIYRRDGCVLGFVSHDRDLRFDDILHRAAPGVLPAALRLTDGLDGDSAEMQGPLGHWSLSERDLEQGRFDDARVAIGAVDWETGEAQALFHGTLGAVSREAGAFVAELHSAKAALDVDVVPRTSPSCRAQFCGRGCSLPAPAFSREASILSVDPDAGRLVVDLAEATPYAGGELRMLTGPDTGLRARIVGVDGDGLVLAETFQLSADHVGQRVRLLEGCDHTLATCAARFGNAINFQGEPFLPGNDLVARYAGPG